MRDLISIFFSILLLIISFFWTVDCPEGYRGINCTDVCPISTYGPGCRQTCNCLPCHHIYGCNVTLKTEGKQTQYIRIRILYTSCDKSISFTAYCLLLEMFSTNMVLYSKSCIFTDIYAYNI